MGERLSSERDESAALAIDGLAFGVDPLGAIFVFHPHTGRLRAQWVRAGAGLDIPMAVAGLWSAYRACREALGHLEIAAPQSDISPIPIKFITLEMGEQAVIVTHTGAYALACVFEGSIPLGMARFVASRIAASLLPKWRSPADLSLIRNTVDAPSAEAPATLEAPGNAAPALASFAYREPLAPVPVHQMPDEFIEPPPRTLDFPSKGSALMQGGAHPAEPAGLPAVGGHAAVAAAHLTPVHSPVRASAEEVDRVNRVLAYLEQRAPEPHIARLRVALRAGLTPLALSHPQTLGPNALVLIETAVEDILGVDLSDSEALP